MTSGEMVDLTPELLAPICRKWHIERLSVFGSRARGTATDASDIDLMVRFEHDVELGVWDLVRLQEELEALLGRSVDLVEAGTIENPFRKASIERDLKVVYAA